MNSSSFSASSLFNLPQLDGNITRLSISESCISEITGLPIPVVISQRNVHISSERRIPVRKVIKRNNIFLQALALPSVMNINPRSVYNKVDEFLTLVDQYETDLIFMSETWDRVDKPLETIIKLEEHKVFTAVNPRNFKGGKPAIIVNERKFHVQPLSPDPITVPDGVEAVWVLLTPKTCKPNTLVKHIAAAAIYYRGPKSTKKEELFDHVAQTYHFLSAKYGQGLHFLIAGDTNRLNLSPILNLSPALKQCVTVPTRLHPPRILDPVISTLHKYYLSPITKPPLQNDEDKKGKPSDHLVVVMYPISSQLDCPPPKKRLIECRPLPQSGIDKLGSWIQKQTWRQIYDCEDAHSKARVFQNMLKEKLDEYLPLKTLKVTSDDKPWITQKVKGLDRKCKREFYKNHKSVKWDKLIEEFDLECESAKEHYYKNTVEDLKTSNVSQWYSKVKRMAGTSIENQEHVYVDELQGLSTQEQAEQIAQHYAKVSNEYDHLKTEDIPKESYETASPPPRIHAFQIHERIQKMSSKKSTVKDDIPMRIIKEFSVELSEPLEHILNFGIYHGQYPDIWKFQQITPAPKVYPPKLVKDLRPISGLKNFGKIADSFVAEFIITDMKPFKDPAQFGNEKGVSIQHYLLKMIHTILLAVDANSKNQAKAVIVQMIDWKGAFDRQCHKLGVQSFLNNGVRKSLIPILISYFQNRQMFVKWNGCHSTPHSLTGGGAQGGELGQLEYLAQSNDNVDFLDLESKYKFIDDLSMLEVINLVLCGISAYNFRTHVASDIAAHGQYLLIDNVKSQEYLDKVEAWTSLNKMCLNREKSKYIIFNFTKNFQFSTRVKLDNSLLEEVSDCRLLGVILENDLSFEKNTQSIVKKGYTRMIILSKLYAFNLPVEEMVNMYILFIRSVLEQSCIVWHSSITVDDSNAIERVQKTALRIILAEDYSDYHSALQLTELSTLIERRSQLCLKFAKRHVRKGKDDGLFPRNVKIVNTRPHEAFFVTPARTDRLAKSAVPYMQRLLNNQ